MQTFEFPPLESPAGMTAISASGFTPPVPPAPPVDVEAEVAAARAAGHEAGFQAGLIEAEQHMALALTALQTAAAEVTAERARLSAAVEPAAVDLALRIAGQAVAAELAVTPARVVDVVRGALRRLVERDRVTILVNPEDLVLVRTASASLVAELGGIEHCDVQAERRVGRGGAIVRTVEGEVDATLATKLERAREVLEEELRGA